MIARWPEWAKHYHVRACMPMMWNTAIYVRGWWQKLSSYVRKADGSRLAKSLLCANDGTATPTTMTLLLRQPSRWLFYWCYYYLYMEQWPEGLCRCWSRQAEWIGKMLGAVWKNVGSVTRTTLSPLSVISAEAEVKRPPRGLYRGREADFSALPMRWQDWPQNRSEWLWNSLCDVDYDYIKIQVDHL